MADMQPNQESWENQWQQAFEGAETPPPDHVWKNIEGELAVQETGRYRKGFLLYRAVAAVLLLLIAGLTWYIIAQPTDEESLVNLADSSKSVKQPSEMLIAPVPERAEVGDSSLEPPLAEVPLSSTAEAGRAESSSEVADQEGRVSTGSSNTVTTAEKPSLATTESSGVTNNTPVSAASSSESVAPASDNFAPAAPLPSTDQAQQASRSLAPISRVTSEAVADASPVRLPSQSETVLYRVPQIPTASDEKDRPPVSLFAGLSLAPGYFDPQFQATASNFGAAALSPSPSPSFGMLDMNTANAYETPASAATIGVENEPELSFTYGFDVGMRLSEHWVVESGIDYNRFSTSTASRWVVADVASGQRFAYVATNANTLNRNLNQAPNTSTALNNAYEFIAVPVKVGYRLSVSKFQFTVSSGVAANFFLQNAISASSAASELSTYRISASESGSPFNTVYYSGLLSGGVNYNVLGHYYLSLMPTYSFALTSLTRVDSNLSSNPYIFGINLGFQYQF